MKISKTRPLRLVIWSAAFVFLLACTAQRNDPKINNHSGSDADYIRNSCAYSFSQGGPATENQNTHQFKKAFFGVSFDFAQIQAVAGASAREIVSYMRKTGTQVFSISEPSEACHHFAEIERLPQELTKVWTNGNETSTMGPFGPSQIFLSHLKVRNSEAKPAVILRTDSDRWTLLHGFLNFLFHKYRLDQLGFDENKFKAQLSQTRAAYALGFPEGSKTFISESDAVQFLQITEELVAKNWQNLVITYLEGINAELILLAMAKSSDLQLITLYNIQSANHQIATYRSAALQNLRELHEQLLTIQAKLKPLQSVILDVHIQDLCDEVLRQMSQVNSAN